jgi:hypothetical protein
MEACPKCNFVLTPGAVECPSCGVILAKLRAGLSRPFQSTPPNPYAPPLAAIESPPMAFPAAVPAQDAITRSTVEALETVRPWLRFIVIYGFVMISLMLLGAVGMLGFGLARTEMLPLALFYLLYGGVGFALLAPLRRSSAALGQLATNTSTCLETYTREQAAFWRRWGLICAVSLVLIGLGMVIGIGAAMFAAASR